ncbi:MAG TPA: VWA domain-containing protein [Terracidiphilus sp.]|nr:VWA domain-containing protein [Terracidiphilus sp.]
MTPRTNAAQAVPAGAAADVPTTLDVVVTDKAERPVAGLQAADFKVLDNKQPRNVIGVRQVDGETPNADPPVQAFLLVDIVNSPFDTMATERKNIEDYLRQSGGHLPVPTSFVFLTETELKYQGQPTRDANVLQDNLEKNPTPQRSSQPQAGYQEWVQMREKSLQALNGLALKLRDEPGRKLVIWISPGWESFSNVSDQKSPKELDALFNYIVGISTVMREARITLYSVDPYGAPRDLAMAGNSYYMEYVKGVSSPKQTNNGDLMLQVIATQTGGKVLYGNNNIAKMIDQCLADAQAFYVLTFNAPHATHPNEYNGIQVQVNKPGLKARARTGFYAQP